MRTRVSDDKRTESDAANWCLRIFMLCFPSLLLRSPSCWSVRAFRAFYWSLAWRRWENIYCQPIISSFFLSPPPGEFISMSRDRGSFRLKDLRDKKMTLKSVKRETQQSAQLWNDLIHHNDLNTISLWTQKLRKFSGNYQHKSSWKLQ